MPLHICTALLTLAAFLPENALEITRTDFDIGLSRDGRPLTVHRVGPLADADRRPAVLIVAGTDGRHRAGIDVARRLADHFANEPQRLHGRTIYILPDLNPDHSAFRAEPGTPDMDWGRTLAPYDADRDGRVGEDGGDDLNGDGVITMMRVRDPESRFGLRVEWVIDDDDPRLMRRADRSKGEIPTHALLIESLDSDGDGRFAEDGIAGEMGGGIDLNLNFPALWPEFTDGAGVVPLSEPESLAFVEWLRSRDNIQAVLVYGPHDNMVTMPAVGRFDATGRVPLGIEEGDRAVHERISERYRALSGRSRASEVSDAGSLPRWTYAHLGLPTFTTRLWNGEMPADETSDAESERPQAPAAPADDGISGSWSILAEIEMMPDPIPLSITMTLEPDGSLSGTISAMGQPTAFTGGSWNPATGEVSLSFTAMDMTNTVQATVSDNQLTGTVGSDMFAASLTGTRTPPAPARAAGSTTESPAAARGRTAGAARTGAAPRGRGGERAAGDDAFWLSVSDAHEGKGFIEWSAFDHPQLGPVEIGGFVPSFRWNPPESMIESLVEQQAEFVSELLSELPVITMERRFTERVAEGLWRIGIRVRNEGVMPSSSAMLDKARRHAPLITALEVPLASVISGSRVTRLPSLRSGAHADAEWLVRADDGSTLTITLRSRIHGDQTLSIELKEGR